MEMRWDEETGNTKGTGENGSQDNQGGRRDRNGRRAASAGKKAAFAHGGFLAGWQCVDLTQAQKKRGGIEIVVNQ